MSPWQRFFTNALLRAPQELLTGLLRVLLFLLLVLIILLLRLWEWLVWLWHTDNLFEEETEQDCGRLPEALIRRPDPAIYSQSYLKAQGLPVTWNNPDIWVAPASNPAAIEPDSYHLQADTDYIVSVQVHNAATDPAIGVKVRLVYRPWSFNSPDLVPVETDAAGNEVFRFADVAPMGASIVQFSWHTPAVAPGESAHFCLQAHLSHPLDINTGNNVGQENTNVYSANPGHVAPGEEAVVDIPLFNTGRETVGVRFRWDAYAIDEQDRVELQLETTCGRPRLPASVRLAHALPTVGIPSQAGGAERATARGPFGAFELGTPKSRARLAKTRYAGFEPFRQTLLGRDYSLPAGMWVTHNLAADQLRLAPAEQRLAQVTIKVPDTAADGTRLPVNITAETDDGVLLGGVTMLFEVQA